MTSDLSTNLLNYMWLLDWIATNDRIKDKVKQNLENTDFALKLYSGNKTRRDQMDLNKT